MANTSRSANRKPTNRAGIIKFSDKEQTVLLRDASSEGARLRLMGNADVPDTFQLIAPMEKIDVACSVIWRRGQDVGVKFEA